MDYKNESKVIEMLSSMNLSDLDIKIVKNFVLNGYSIIEQTDEEYASFLSQANEKNERRPSDCMAYSAVYRNGTWTAYIMTGNAYSKKLGECAYPNCAGANANLKWNSLKNNSKEEDCKNLYYFDNENKNCDSQEFCGMYMYYGLQTFESKRECLANTNEVNCTINEDCPVAMNLCGDPTGPNFGYCNSKNKIPICINGKCKKDGTINCENEKCTYNFSNGRKAEVKIMPETASENAIKRLGELNFTIELKEIGKEEDNKTLIYELKGNKEGKFLGIFKIIAKVKAEVDAETGKIKVIKPWWSFLASGI
jgi:hypothetical protein